MSMNMNEAALVRIGEIEAALAEKEAEVKGLRDDLRHARQQADNAFDSGFSVGIGKVNDNDQRCQHLISKRKAAEREAQGLREELVRLPHGGYETFKDIVDGCLEKLAKFADTIVAQEFDLNRAKDVHADNVNELSAQAQEIKTLHEMIGKLNERIRMWEKDGPAAMAENERLMKVIDETVGAKERIISDQAAVIERAREALSDEARGYRSYAEDQGCNAGNHDGGSSSTCEHCHTLQHAETLENIIAALSAPQPAQESEPCGECDQCVTGHQACYSPIAAPKKKCGFPERHNNPTFPDRCPDCGKDNS